MLLQQFDQDSESRVDVSANRSPDRFRVAVSQRCKHLLMVLCGRIVSGIVQHVEIGTDLQPQVLDDVEHVFRARGSIDGEMKGVVGPEVGSGVEQRVLTKVWAPAKNVGEAWLLIRKARTALSVRHGRQKRPDYGNSG
ncbi:hypothetical protein NKJ22_25110 [Mesorhizobium sp. M0220]